MRVGHGERLLRHSFENVWQLVRGLPQGVGGNVSVLFGHGGRIVADELPRYGVRYASSFEQGGVQSKGAPSPAFDIKRGADWLGKFGQVRLVRKWGDVHVLVGGSERERRLVRAWCAVYATFLVFIDPLADEIVLAA